MAYKEIEPKNWTYEKEGDQIEGVLVRVQENVGVNQSMLYIIETPEGVKSVWGSVILDERMAFARVGDKVRITYKGFGEEKKGKHAPKIFKVEIDRDNE